jgi:hypothetical protein
MVLLDPNLVQRVMSGSKTSLTELVQAALKDYTPENQISSEQTSLKRPFPIRVTLSQHYFFSDRDIEMALEKLSHKASHE